MIKLCSICSKQFKAIQKTEKYCCTKCAYEAIKNNKVKNMEKTTESKMTLEEMAAQRELDAKPFAEVSDSEKINRLVRVIKEMEWGTSNLIGRMSKMDETIYLLKNHSHNDTGVVIPVDKAQVSSNPNSIGGQVMSNRKPLLS